MKIVFICSPYRGDVDTNVAKTKRYCWFAYSKGVVPCAPHLHNPQFLDDEIKEERKAGIKMGLEVLKRADALWCFGRQLTDGMRQELKFAIENDIPIKYFNDQCQEVKYNE